MTNGERPEIRPSIEAERKVLFEKAIGELAESISGAGNSLATEQLHAVADRMLDGRWATAMRDYKTLVGSLSIPPIPEYPHNKKTRAENLDIVMENNAERVQKAWRNMQELFRSGTVLGRQTLGEAYMSDATAKELVIFLAKSQGHK